MDLSKIITPTLLLDKEKTISNISRMISRSEIFDIKLRPHFKTHQSLEVGRWYRNLGVDKITVSSLNMAEYFARDGWDDILIAFPFNPREIDGINMLAKKVNLTLTIPNYESAQLLAKLASSKLNVMIKIDTGYGRSGTTWDNSEDLKLITKTILSNNLLKFIGLLTHAGHTYNANSRESIESIYHDTVKKMNLSKKSIGLDNIIISVGDTPSASITNSFGDIDELRVGNFVFYDLMQYFLGSCKLEDISVVAACPVVDIQNKRKKLVIYGGAVHLSKDRIKLNGRDIFGLMVKLQNNTWTLEAVNIFVSSLSQEHGIIEFDEKIDKDIKIGDLIGVIPVHSCLTANLLRGYTSFTGEYIDHMNTHVIS